MNALSPDNVTHILLDGLVNVDATSDTYLINTSTKTTSDSLGDSGDFTFLDRSIVSSVYLSMATLGFVLNALALVVVWHGCNLSKEVRIQVLNLAVVDVLMSIFGATRTVLENLLPSFTLNASLCKFILFAVHSSHYISLLCNASISVERFVIVYFPFKASNYTSIHKIAVVLLVWFTGLLSAIELLFGTHVVTTSGVSECINSSPLNTLSFELQMWMWCLKYFLPTFIIITAYTLVFVRMCINKREGIRRHLSNQWKKDLNKVNKI